MKNLYMEKKETLCEIIGIILGEGYLLNNKYFPE